MSQKSFPLKRKSSRHKSLDLDDLIILVDNLDQWTRKDSERVLAEAVSEMGEVYLERVKANTPIRDQRGFPPPYSRPAEDGGDGFMRDSWELTSVTPLPNRRYQVTVKNDARFAEAVEYGHDQDTKRYVRQIGHQLRNPKVKGIHTIQQTREELNESKEMERVLERKFNKELKRLFNGK